MASITGQDRFFSGGVNASIPTHLLPEGSVVRTINCRFLRGAITNAVGFDEVKLSYALGANKRLFASKVTYDNILDRGDLQLLAPLSTFVGGYLVAVISSRMLLINPDTGSVADITPIDSFIADNSQQNIMSYIGDDGGASGIGGTLVVFNWPNRPIFVTFHGARVSSEVLMEMPPARCGATITNRAFIISGDNLLLASDALGQTPNAPLTFTETFTPSSGFYGQVFTIGSVLDGEYVTAICRLPKFLGPSTEFFSHSIYVFSETRRYIVAAGAAREIWGVPGYNFIIYGGTSEGGSGPRACAVVGSSIVYEDTLGRVKQIIEDEMRDTGLQDNYFDAPLGQYLSQDEHDFSFREWYQELDHRYATVKSNRNRVYATVYPFDAPAIDKFGRPVKTISHRALAIASRDSQVDVGPVAKLTWEGFYDWFQPCLTSTLRNEFYVFAKNRDGKNTLLKQNHQKRDNHTSVVFTRAYFANTDPAEGGAGNGRSLLKGQLFFRKIAGKFRVRISFLANGKWMLAKECLAEKAVLNFTVSNPIISNSYGIPLRIELQHEGCPFELESIWVAGETHKGF